MFEAEGGDGVAHGVGAVAGAVVGINALDGDAVFLEEGQRGVEEEDGAVGAFIREELGEGEAGVIVDGDVEIFPAGAPDVIVLARPSTNPHLSPPPPRRSPVTRWPGRTMARPFSSLHLSRTPPPRRASFLMSKWRSSPGWARS